MRGTTLIMTAFLLLAGMLVPGAAAEPDPPECYDRQPIVDAGVASVWLTRSCSVRVEVDEDAVAVQQPDVPDKDVYLPKYPCPVGFYGYYAKALDAGPVTFWSWRCSAGPPP